MVNQKEPLCLQPMTARDARYAQHAAARRAAEREATARPDIVRGILRDIYQTMADELQTKAGEP